MRTCFFAFAAFVVASLAMLSNTSPPAFAVAVGPPSVSITSPSDGDVIPLNTVITFSGIGTDSDGTLLVRGQLFWSSSQNGFLGTGPGFTRNSSTLSLGSHTIGLLATGGNNMQNFASVTIWIGPPPTATPTNTPTAVPTNTPTRTPVPPTSTNTPVPPTSTSTPLPPTSTSTSVPATSTRAPATSTNTPVPPTSTATRTVAPSATSTPPVTSTPSTARRCADFNGDGRVSWRDVFIIAEAVGHHTHDLRFDVNGNGRVGWGDVWATMWQVGRRCGNGPVTTPTHAPEPTSTPTLAVASPRTGDASATPTETPLPLD